jgi:hypothetical protein
MTNLTVFWAGDFRYFGRGYGSNPCVPHSTFLSGFQPLFVWFRGWKFFPLALVFECGIPQKAGGGVNETGRFLVGEADMIPPPLKFCRRKEPCCPVCSHCHLGRLQKLLQFLYSFGKVQVGQAFK